MTEKEVEEEIIDEKSEQKVDYAPMFEALSGQIEALEAAIFDLGQKIDILIRDDEPEQDSYGDDEDEISEADLKEYIDSLDESEKVKLYTILMRHDDAN